MQQTHRRIPNLPFLSTTNEESNMRIAISLIAVGLIAVPAIAADAPARKSGLWEITSQASAGGQKMPGTTMQMCIEQGRDDVSSDPREARRQCSKMEVRRSGGQMTIDSVCKHERHTVTGRTVISGDLASNYRMENTSRFEPPMNGMQTMSSTMTGKWLGPCKPGQKHGSMVMQGMGPGGMNIDPEMMKRMQQMQQQYGR
jgi:hypothetical protein